MARPARLAAVLAHPRLPWIAALLSVLLASPAVAQGLQLDDHLHRAWIELVLRGEAPGPWWDFYAVARDPESNRAAMDLGASPWWMLFELRIRFWRPLSAATHVLDHALWPSAPWLMHLVSLAWLGALVLGVGALMRRLLRPAWVAGLGTLLFAVDEAHAIPASWIAQRNALVAATLTVVMLWAHDRARRDGWRPGRWLAPSSWAAALLAGESAVAGLGYLLAHALLLEPTSSERGRLRSRMLAAARALWPFVLVLIAWRLIYSGLGYGAYGSGVYLDPGQEPGAWISVLPQRASALVLGALTWIDAETWAADPSGTTIGLAALGLAVVVLALAPRLARDRGLATLVVGGVLAVLPATAAAPSDRLLLLVTLGTSAALAGVVAVAVGRDELTPHGTSVRALARVLLGPVLVVHGLWAPVATTRRVVERGRVLELARQATVQGVPSDPDLAERTLVIVNAPPTFVAASLWLDPGRGDRVLPRRLRLLGSTFGPVIVQRPDARTLVLQPVGGYLGDPFTSLLRGPAHPLAAGHRVELEGWTVEVLGVAKGRATSVRISFDEALDDPSLRFITWRGDRFVPFDVPAVGRSVALPAVGSVPAPKRGPDTATTQ